MTSHHAFSWGYAGWGNHTAQMVADAILMGRRVEAPKRRVIFVGSCESPHARHSCHRGLVVTQLLETTKWHGVADADAIPSLQVEI